VHIGIFTSLFCCFPQPSSTDAAMVRFDTSSIRALFRRDDVD
jgi:hypothetical protein